MSKRRLDVLERFEPLFEGPETSFEGFLRRRERKQRNQRIAAGAVGIAVFAAAIFIATLDRPTERNRTPATDGPAPTTRPAAVAGLDRDYVVDLDTGVMTPLPTAILRSLGETDEGRLPESLYAASPDGSRLAYVVTGDDGTPQIFIANIDGTGVRQMTHDPVGAGSPGWSPDGASVAFQGFGGGQVQNLFVIDVATGAITQITHEDDDSLWTPTFTPDGASLLYTGGPNEAPVLRTVPIAGGESTLLIGPEGDAVGDLTDAANGSMSPDGSMVAFTGSQVVSPGPGHWVANTDGSERRSIPCQWLAPAGSWSPDGTRIACRGSADTWSTDGGVLGRITVVDVATGDAWRVADGASAIWLDDHTLLVEA